MSERYSTRFSLVENLYVEDAPVIISAGNLLKDSQTGKVLVQLKIKNISAKIIKAARVSIHAFDMVGKPLEDAEKEYLDIAVGRGQEFGQKVAILLPDISTNGFTVEVRQVAFADGSIWESAENTVWEPLPKEETASLFLQDPELFKQFQLKYGENCDTIPIAYKDLWLCVCGTWNNDNACYSCNKEKADLLPFDLDSLIYEKNARLEQERAEQEARELAEKEAARKKAEEKEKKRAKTLAFTKKVSIATLVTFLVAFLVYAVGWHAIPYTRYKKACDALRSQDFDAAYSAFDALGEFSDSAEKAAESLYQKGVWLMNSGEYSDAVSEFDKIPDFLDSAELSKLCKNEAIYIDANALFETGQYEEAITLFETIKDFKDSEERVKESKYKYALASFDSGKYEEAIALFETIKDFKDSEERVKESKYKYALASFDSENYEMAYTLFNELLPYKDVEEHLPEAKYRYAISLSERKDLAKASRLFKELGDYKDSDSRYQETYYKYALDLMDSKQFFKAVGIFQSLDKYEDSKTKLNEAKYEYVLSNKNNIDYTTYNYLKDLKAAKYKDSDKIYSSLYKWSVKIIMNDSEHDTTTNKNVISKYGYFYCHVTLSGGHPGEQIKLKYVLYFPDGSSYTDKWDSDYSDGDSGTCWGYYSTPAYGAAGKFRVKIYNNSNGTLLGEGSIYIS